MGGDEAGTFKLAGLRGGRDRRVTLALRQRKRRILGCGLHMLRLLLGRRNVALLGERDLLWRRSRRNPAGAAVEADSRRVVDDDGLAVDVGDCDAADVVDGPVVEERPIPPVAALIAGPAVAEPIIDAAIETDFGSPIAIVENVGAASFQAQ
jgi:hypothetical protein